MATLASSGRITVKEGEVEISRLQHAWSRTIYSTPSGCLNTGFTAEALKAIDPFDRFQLAHVVEVCRESRSLSDAGRQLFSVSRLDKKIPNDADRLRIDLARFRITWADIISERS